VRCSRSILVAPALALACLLPFPLPALAAGADREDLWLHLTIEEPDAADGDDVRVRINFPLRFAEALLPLMEGGTNLRQGRVRLDIDDSDIGAADLAAAWQAVREAREGQFVVLQPHRGRSGDERVEAARVGDTLVVRARDGISQAKIQVPMRVAESLVKAATDTEADDPAEIDLAALLRDMREIGPGELVRATDGDSHVRIWIDDDEESD
jgi:hypothetical protein